MARSKKHPYGPAMSSLPRMKQRFVELCMEQPAAPRTKILRMCGYKYGDDSCAKQAWRWSHDPTIIEALKEASVAKLHLVLPKAAIEGLVDNPNSRHHMKAWLKVTKWVLLYKKSWPSPGPANFFIA